MLRLTWHAGDARVRPEPNTDKPHTAQEHRDLLLTTEQFMRFNLHMALQPQLRLQTRAEPLPQHIQLLPLRAVDSQPPNYSDWTPPAPTSSDADAEAASEPPSGGAPQSSSAAAAAGSAAAQAAPSAAAAAATPTLGDNSDDLPAGVFRSATATAGKEQEEEDDDDDEDADDSAAKLSVGATADRLWQITYEGGMQVRIYLLAEPPSEGKVRYLVKLGAVKDTATLLPGLDVLFYVDEDASVVKRLDAGEDVYITNPCFNTHMAWYWLYYKFPHL
jgi:hypothetical protein